jgi:hypothetical protein
MCADRGWSSGASKSTGAMARRCSGSRSLHFMEAASSPSATAMICTFSTPISGALHGSISGLAAAGWSSGACVMATKNRNRARLKADKIREIKSSLTMMEGELRAAAAQAEIGSAAGDFPSTRQTLACIARWRRSSRTRSSGGGLSLADGRGGGRAG